MASIHIKSRLKMQKGEYLGCKILSVMMIPLFTYFDLFFVLESNPLKPERFTFSWDFHKEQSTYKFSSQFYHQLLIVEQCTLQLHIKQAKTTSKLCKKFL